MKYRINCFDRFKGFKFFFELETNLKDVEYWAKAKAKEYNKDPKYPWLRGGNKIAYVAVENGLLLPLVGGKKRV
jgi:hypothetical protein